MVRPNSLSHVLASKVASTHPLASRITGYLRHFLQTFSFCFWPTSGSCRLPLLVVVGVGWIDGRIGVEKKRIGLVAEKFEYFGILVEVVIVEMQLVDRG
ncbi:hypothetical protein Tco_0284552 [Tanacetum coccineum]